MKCENSHSQCPDITLLSQLLERTAQKSWEGTVMPNLDQGVFQMTLALNTVGMSLLLG